MHYFFVPSSANAFDYTLHTNIVPIVSFSSGQQQGKIWALGTYLD